MCWRVLLVFGSLKSGFWLSQNMSKITHRNCHSISPGKSETAQFNMHFRLLICQLYLANCYLQTERSRKNYAVRKKKEGEEIGVFKDKRRASDIRMKNVERCPIHTRRLSSESRERLIHSRVDRVVFHGVWKWYCKICWIYNFETHCCLCQTVRWVHKKEILAKANYRTSLSLSLCVEIMNEVGNGVNKMLNASSWENIVFQLLLIFHSHFHFRLVRPLSH